MFHRTIQKLNVLYDCISGTNIFFSKTQEFVKFLLCRIQTKFTMVTKSPKFPVKSHPVTLSEADTSSFFMCRFQ